MRGGKVFADRISFAAWIFCISLVLCVASHAQRVRLMAANITSGNNQAYLDPGIRIFQGVDPDIVMIQEFNYGNNSAATIQGFVTSTFGPEFTYFRESVGNDQIPNGIISRYPILESGEWDDTQVSGSRDFAWAHIDIPGPKDLWVVSVHMLTDGSKRPAEATALRSLIQANVPATDYLVIGGDFNSDSRTESQFSTLSSVVVTSGPYPADGSGNTNTNASRGKPYDAVLPNTALHSLQVPVVIGASTFANGLVVDTQVYSPLAEISPAQSGDSGVSGMQHMAVVRDFMLPSNPPTIASTSPLTGGTVGTAVSRTISATGGTSPYTWSVSSGSIPNGLTFSSAGVLSGTPTAEGTFTFTALVTDSASATASKSFSITITPTLAISSAAPLAGGFVGTAVLQTLSASGGTSPYTWSVSSGSVPSGLTFSNSGVLSGTPTASGTFAFTALVTDSASATASKSFSITITQTLAVASASPLNGGTVGTFVSRTLAANGGMPPYTWSTVPRSVPNGLNFTNAGVLSGTPTTAGTYTFTVSVTDSASATASKSFSMTITPTLVVSSASPLDGGAVGTAVSRTLAASGGTSPYTWSVASGTVPDGLTLSNAGILGGTPTAAGTFTFTASVTDSASATASKSFSMTITPTLVVSTASPLAGGTVGTAVSRTLAASGGTSPYTWSVASGTVPDGLTFSNAGILSGTPTAAGTFTFTALATDSAGATAGKSFSITITPTLAIVPLSVLADGTVGSVYSLNLEAAGGTSPYQWMLMSGDLPPGLSLNTAGALTGTPSLAGSFGFVAQVTDAASATVSRNFTVTVREPLETFLTSHGLTAGSASMDPDGDGIANLVEFLLGGNPIQPDVSILPALSFPSGGSTVSYQFSVISSPGSVAWKVQSSSDLVVWEDVVPGAGGVTSVITPDGAMNRVSISIPAAPGQLHIRLAVTGP